MQVVGWPEPASVVDAIESIRSSVAILRRAAAEADGVIFVQESLSQVPFLGLAGAFIGPLQEGRRLGGWAFPQGDQEFRRLKGFAAKHRNS
jgi:hypothetical protein